MYYFGMNLNLQRLPQAYGGQPANLRQPAAAITAVRAVWRRANRLREHTVNALIVIEARIICWLFQPSH
jgi:hypothetical protein